MNNLSRKIFWNLTVIAAVFFLFDFLIFYIDTKKAINTNVKNIYIFYKEFYSKSSTNKTLVDEYILDKNNHYRRIVNKTSVKKPILLFGCSFTYGHKIPENTIFSEVLGKYTGRPVYNRAMHGFGVQQMLFQLENKEFYNIIPQPEYIIYTYIGDHVRRMYLPSVLFVREYYDIRYKYKNSTLMRCCNNKLNKKTILISAIESFLYKKKLYRSNLKKNEELLKQHLLTSKKYVDINWPGTKFVILAYLDTKELDDISNELKEAGFIIINRKDIAPFDDFDTRFCLSSIDVHPNENAWEYIVPKLINKLKTDD